MSEREDAESIEKMWTDVNKQGDDDTPYDPESAPRSRDNEDEGAAPTRD